MDHVRQLGPPMTARILPSVAASYSWPNILSSRMLCLLPPRLRSIGTTYCDKCGATSCIAASSVLSPVGPAYSRSMMRMGSCRSLNPRFFTVGQIRDVVSGGGVVRSPYRAFVMSRSFVCLYSLAVVNGVCVVLSSAMRASCGAWHMSPSAHWQISRLPFKVWSCDRSSGLRRRYCLYCSS